MDYEKSINEVRRRAGPISRDEAEAVTGAYLENLRERLSGDRPGELASHLPGGLAARLEGRGGGEGPRARNPPRLGAGGARTRGPPLLRIFERRIDSLGPSDAPVPNEG